MDVVKFFQCPNFLVGAVHTFVLKSIQDFEKKNAYKVFQNKENYKRLIDKLFVRLDFPELRESVRYSREFWKRDEKSNYDF